MYGPHDDFNPATAQVIPALIRRCLDGENPLVVWGDGSALRDFVFSRDVAAWALDVTARGPACEPLNLGMGQGVSIRELAEAVVSVVDPTLTLAWDPTKPTGDPVRILSMEKTTALLGPLRRTPLVEGLRQTVAWYRQARASGKPPLERHHG